MIYDFWWETGNKSSHFLVDISAPRETVEQMVSKYVSSNSKDSFVGFLRTHAIPARGITPIEVEFYKRESEMKEQTMAPDFALCAEIRQVQEKARA